MTRNLQNYHLNLNYLPVITILPGYSKCCLSMHPEFYFSALGT